MLQHIIIYKSNSRFSSPSFAFIIFTLFESLYTTFSSVTLGICAHSGIRALMVLFILELFILNKVESRLSARYSSSSTPACTNHIIMQLTLCTEAVQFGYRLEHLRSRGKENLILQNTETVFLTLCMTWTKMLSTQTVLL